MQALPVTGLLPAAPASDANTEEAPPGAMPFRATFAAVLEMVVGEPPPAGLSAEPPRDAQDAPAPSADETPLLPGTLEALTLLLGPVPAPPALLPPAPATTSARPAESVPAAPLVHGAGPPLAVGKALAREPAAPTGDAPTSDPVSGLALAPPPEHAPVVSRVTDFPPDRDTSSQLGTWQSVPGEADWAHAGPFVGRAPAVPRDPPTREPEAGEGSLAPARSGAHTPAGPVPPGTATQQVADPVSVSATTTNPAAAPGTARLPAAEAAALLAARLGSPLELFGGRPASAPSAAAPKDVAAPGALPGTADVVDRRGLERQVGPVRPEGAAAAAVTLPSDEPSSWPTAARSPQAPGPLDTAAVSATVAEAGPSPAFPTREGQHEPAAFHPAAPTVAPAAAPGGEMAPAAGPPSRSSPGDAPATEVRGLLTAMEPVTERRDTAGTARASGPGTAAETLAPSPPAGLPLAAPVSAAGPPGDAFPSPAPPAATLVARPDTPLLDQLAEGIRSALDRRQSVRLVLHPEGLGAVGLRVTAGASGTSIHLTADNIATYELLQTTWPQLSHSLQQHGLQVADLVLALAQGASGGPGGGPFAAPTQPPQMGGRPARAGARAGRTTIAEDVQVEPLSRVDYRV